MLVGRHGQQHEVRVCAELDGVQGRVGGSSRYSRATREKRNCPSVSTFAATSMEANGRSTIRRIPVTSPPATDTVLRLETSRYTCSFTPGTAAFRPRQYEHLGCNPLILKLPCASGSAFS